MADRTRRPARWRRVELDDGSEVFVSSTADPDRFVVGRASCGGSSFGFVWRDGYRWGAETKDSAEVWEEATGRRWPTLRLACEALVREMEEGGSDG